MLGHKMFQMLSAEFTDTYGTIRGRRSAEPFDRIDLFQSERVLEKVDLFQADLVDRVLTDLRPGVVLNCAGVVKHRPAAQDAIPSITMNALLPHRLAASI